MAAYRPLGQFNQYFLNDGTVNNGGSITFYATDLTTPKDTYSDLGLTVVNTNPVVLDSAGRLSTDVWGSGDYGAVIKDRSGTVIETRNNIQPSAGTGSSIPALVTGDFLTNDGSSLIWQGITQVPDPTGYAGDVLYSDGTLPYWGAIPSAATPDIVVTSNSFRAGVSTNTSKFFVQMGTGTAPASGTPDTGVTVTFPTPFTTCMHVSVMIDSTHTSQILVPYLQSPPLSSSFGVTFSDAVQHNIVSNVVFTWVAFGFLTVP